MDSYEERILTKEKLANMTYYLIVGLVSIVSSVFLPLINSTIDGGFNLPTTAAGWFVFIISKLSIALINIIIFHCFLQQAKVNVKDNSRYLEALTLLSKLKDDKNVIPRSPTKYTATTWFTKGTTLLISSLLSVFAFSNAVLSFDLTVFLANIFTIVLGIVFGYLQMKKTEEYWTGEYWHYALYKKAQCELEEQSLEKEENHIENAI